MSTTEVVVAGGGPTGLVLAAELHLAGAQVVVVERRADQTVDGSRAGGLHARTLEVLDQRGVGDRFVAAGQTHPILGYGGTALSLADQPTRHPHLLALWQGEIERILADWVLGDLGVPILRSCEVVGLAQDAGGVDVELSDGTTRRVAYLVGCDGGRSTVRKAAGIAFPGLDASTSWMIAQVDLDEPALGLRPEGGGIGPVDRVAGGSPYGVVLKEPEVRLAGQPPSLEELRAALRDAYGTDFGARQPRWISRFTDASRQAATYRQGRVLVAGDAAHVHPPQGGQGLNVGVQDAVNLGWKLALVAAGTAPESLLDSYHAERHPVGARVLQNTMAQVALATGDERHRALRESVHELLALDEPRRRVAAMVSGLDVRYDLGGEHPLVGRRMPDLDLETAAGPTTALALLHDARPLLLDLGGVSGLDLGPWSDRVRLVVATTPGPWDLPVVGAVPPPAAVLVRPDGHVAWVPGAGEPPLQQALTTWFGPPA
ncbi:FAD-dependent monooxygenase [Aquihabitans sp. G128]|uniref:FAD-dependent monooxygenase n=1 Tax=Aquihabitans sp. G128 TaxID=2849779 RepID=UPI001C223B0E|nr:FAD-dependent monooxygenase [Aquihabitans sp. G128]QXC62743.1 FAD-dependent monooxygenase [Aquihabitans sp. G128]